MDDYQKVMALAKVFRYTKVKYRDTRKQLKDHFNTDMLMTAKEYYNLRNRRPGDLKDDGIAGTLIAIFEDADWDYSYRSVKQNNGMQRLIQLTF